MNGVATTSITTEKHNPTSRSQSSIESQRPTTGQSKTAAASNSSNANKANKAKLTDPTGTQRPQDADRTATKSEPLRSPDTQTP